MHLGEVRFTGRIDIRFGGRQKICFRLTIRECFREGACNCPGARVIPWLNLLNRSLIVR